MAKLGFRQTVRREIGRLTSRYTYLCAMVLLPVAMVLFFVGLLEPGLPLKVPAAVVDMDHSKLSRTVTRSLNATELIDITDKAESYDKAMTMVRSGEIMGFFVIPSNFEKDAISGRKPTLEYYDNLSFFVPGTLAFKGFKTVAVTTSAGIVKTTLTSAGMPDESIMPMLQPMTFSNHPIGNPWLSYAIYLCPSFIFGTFALLIMLATVFSITSEIKHGTSIEWLNGAGNRISVALVGKLLPHFVIWSVMGQFALAVMFCWCGFPCGSLGWLMVAMELFVIAAIAVGVLFSSIFPNPRLAFTLCALFGILSFSFTGFSFPVQSMYGSIAIFSYLMPVRYLFLIYLTMGLNAFPLYFARLYFVALIIFPFVATLLTWRLKRACMKPVYVP